MWWLDINNNGGGTSNEIAYVVNGQDKCNYNNKQWQVKLSSLLGFTCDTIASEWVL